MARIPPLKVEQSHTMMRGNYDVSTRRANYGVPGNAGRAPIPCHWDQSGNDVPGLGMEELSVSVATPRTLPGAHVLPPHPQTYTKGQNGLDRALASLKQIGPEGSDDSGTQTTGGDDVMVGGSGTGDNGSGKLPAGAK